MTWAYPYLLLLLPLPAVLGWLWWRRREKTEAVLCFSSLELITRTGRGRRLSPTPILWGMRLTAAALVILALARPQAGIARNPDQQMGIDIMLCLDASYSMMAEDFDPNRLGAARDVIKWFVQRRPADRIGLVVFAGDAFTICPLTLDHKALLDHLDRVNEKTVATDGTAIGNALATAVNRLSAGRSPSKVVVLLTDGRNNTGEVAPGTAAGLAQAREIKVYTIGVGRLSDAPLPVPDQYGMIRYLNLRDSIDEPGLEQIADRTGGRFFRATDPQGLSQIFNRIDALEKAPLPAPLLRREDRYYYFLWPALVIFCLEILLGRTVWRVVP